MTLSSEFLHWHGYCIFIDTVLCVRPECRIFAVDCIYSDDPQYMSSV